MWSALPVDLNGDSLLDIVSSQQYDSAYCSLQSPGRTFGTPTPCIAMNIRDMASGDIDADGIDDIIAADGSSVVAVFLFPDYPSSGAIRVDVDTSFGGSQSTSAADITGDGLVDVVACCKCGAFSLSLLQPLRVWLWFVVGWDNVPVGLRPVSTVHGRVVCVRSLPADW